MSDGSITISTKLDNAQLEKQLSSLKAKIEKAEDALTKKKGEQSAIKAELDAAMESAHEAELAIKRLKTEMSTLEEATSVDRGPGLDPMEYIAAIERQKEISAELKEQEAALARQDKDAERLANQYAKCTDKVNEITAELGNQKETAGGIVQKIEAANREAEGLGGKSVHMNAAIVKAEKSMGRFGMRLREVVRSALVFTLITQALAKFRGWMGKVVQANGEASAAVARLKGALLTLSQPLVNIIVPAFTALVNVLARVVSTFAQLFSMLTGKSIKSTKDAAKALDQETAALEGTGAAADDAGKSMAGFDEINQLSDASGKSASGSGGKSISPDFEFDTDITDGQLKNILGLVEAVGAAFLAWRISKSLGLSLGQTLGLAAAIYSAVQFVKNVFDAWTNGVDWSNLLGMLGSAAGIAVGLGIALGPAAAGISLIVTGLAMLVTGFRDAFENGWNLENLLLSIGGILATGIGLSLITGSLIPAFIAGIAALVLAITVAYGHGEELLAGVKEILQGFIDFFAGIFTGDIDRAIKGIGEIFSGLKTAVFAIVDSLRDMFISFLDWLDDKTGGRFHGIIEFAKGIVRGFFNWVKETFGEIADAIEQILGGVVKFLSGVFTGDWDKAWEGLTDIFKGFIDLLLGMVESFVNFFVRAINKVIEAANKLSFTAPDWLGGGTFGINIPKVPELHIPRLAAGAVIPPNQEFLAVLGDQKRGTNIEAPVAEIENAVARAMNRSGGAGGGQITIVVKPAPGLTRYLSYELEDEAKRRGVKLVRI